MDEVITCKCGSQSWVIGKSGIRCAKCVYWLPEKFQTIDIDRANGHIIDDIERPHNQVDHSATKGILGE